MKAITKIKLKIFAINFTFELVINSIILGIAYLSGKILETLGFYLAWITFRHAFPKICHFRTNNPIVSICGCLICSVGCFVLAMRLMLPIYISIFSSVLVGIIINFGLYKIEDYLQMKRQIAENSIDIYKMSEDELRNYAKSKGLSEMIIDTLVLKVVHNYRWCEIRDERDYTRHALDYHRKRINEKLNIKL